MPDELVLAAHTWTDNADLIANACVPLGYVDPSWTTLDPTYGMGSWWTRIEMEDFYGHDADPAKSPLEPMDFRDTPYRSRSFRLIAYDPPYVSVGGRATSTIPDTYARYGLIDAPTTPAGLQEYMDEGATEMARLLEVFHPKRPAYMLYKAQDYVSNGTFWDGTGYVRDHCLKLGLEIVDRFELIRRTGPQPKRSTCLYCKKAIQRSTEGAWMDMPRATAPSATCPPDDGLFGNGAVVQHEPDPEATTQDHASRNLSTMYVFRKPKPRARPVEAPALFG